MTTRIFQSRHHTLPSWVPLKFFMGLWLYLCVYLASNWMTNNTNKSQTVNIGWFQLNTQSYLNIKTYVSSYESYIIFYNHSFDNGWDPEALFHWELRKLIKKSQYRFRQWPQHEYRRIENHVCSTLLYLHRGRWPQVTYQTPQKLKCYPLIQYNTIQKWQWLTCELVRESFLLFLCPNKARQRPNNPATANENNDWLHSRW